MCEKYFNVFSSITNNVLKALTKENNESSKRNQRKIRCNTFHA